MRWIFKWFAPWLAFLIHIPVVYGVDCLILYYNNPPREIVDDLDFLLILYYALMLCVAYIFTFFYNGMNFLKSKYRLMVGVVILLFLIIYSIITSSDVFTLQLALHKILIYTTALGSYGIPVLFILYLSEKKK